MYLGRPWRKDAACCWLHCRLSEEIHPDGWDNWNNPENEANACFAEYENSGRGAAAVRAFGTVNDAETLQKQPENLTALRTMFDVKGINCAK